MSLGSLQKGLRFEVSAKKLDIMDHGFAVRIVEKGANVVDSGQRTWSCAAEAPFHVYKRSTLRVSLRGGNYHRALTGIHAPARG